MKFDIFVLPFFIGMIFLVIYIVYKFRFWILQLPENEQKIARKSFFTKSTIVSLKEIFYESLLHRKILKENLLLGYMHCSLAFGWFLLIAIGNLESRLYNLSDFNLPYFPIFFKFFVHNKSNIPFAKLFGFTMDFLLLFVLSGVLLATIKRKFSSLFGMKKTSKLKPADKFALYSLWLIFPLRLLAESSSSGLYLNGGWVTRTLGYALVQLPYPETSSYVFWWMYSTALGTFFFALPWSRYMHIPTEILYIYLKNAGIKTQIVTDSYQQIQLYSCSRCGICINKCQLNTSLNINNIQPVYALRTIREKQQTSEIMNNCLLCGRCEQACPVDIDLNIIRVTERKKLNGFLQNNYQYISTQNVKAESKTEVIYFAGCMTHLTPAIKTGMLNIFKKANVNYDFIDSDGTICCGKPVWMTGNTDAAKSLINKNTEKILASGAKILVTSCPICFKFFKDEYNLPITVKHHTEYIGELLNSERINVSDSAKEFVYHDPCELGRGSEIFDQPRTILSKIGKIKEAAETREKALCCGGSLANTQINYTQQRKISTDVVEKLTENKPGEIITACPLCKKTLNQVTDLPVKDIAEVVSENMN